MNVRLYLWQRTTAAVMAPLVIVHIAVIFYATRHRVLRLVRVRGFDSRLDWPAQYLERMDAAARTAR